MCTVRPASVPVPLTPLPRRDLLEAIAESRSLEGRFKELAATKLELRQPGMLRAKLALGVSAAGITAGTISSGTGGPAFVGALIAGGVAGVVTMIEEGRAMSKRFEPTARSQKTLNATLETLDQLAAELKQASPLRRQVALHFIQRALTQTPPGRTLQPELQRWLDESGLYQAPQSADFFRIAMVLKVLDADFLSVKAPSAQASAVGHYLGVLAKLPEQDRTAVGEVAYRGVVEDPRFDALSVAQKLQLEQALMPYAESDFER